MNRDLATLIEIFKNLGAKDPASWATSEVREDFPRLAMFLFLRAAWQCVVPGGDTTWIDARKGADADPHVPLAGGPLALRRMLAKGIDPLDLTEVVRNAQYELLFDLCYLLSDWTWRREGLGSTSSDVDDVAWGLFETDPDGNPRRSMNGLHEIVLGMDPTGREMRPRT